MSLAIIHTMLWLLIVIAAGRGLNNNMVLIIPGRLERVNARQGSQDATSKIRWSGFCSIEFSVNKKGPYCWEVPSLCSLLSWSFDGNLRR